MSRPDSTENESLVKSLVNDLVDIAVDDANAKLVIKKAKENIATEVRSAPEKFLDRAIKERPDLKDIYQGLVHIKNMLTFHEEVERELQSLSIDFANIYLKRSFGSEESKHQDSGLIAAWKRYDTKYPDNTFWNFFKERFEKLPKEKQEEIKQQRYTSHASQNKLIKKWMLSEIENVNLHNKTTIGTKFDLEQKVQETKLRIIEASGGEDSEISLLLKIMDREGDIEKLSGLVAERRFENYKESRRIVWASVAQKTVDTEEGPREISDFKYSGKTAAKTVYIPYHDIQQAIIDANWVLRAGTEASANYLTAHMLFVVSDQEYVKSEESGKYEGGRSFVDFPIALPLDLMTEQRIFANQSVFEKFLESRGGMVGENKKSSQSYSHSEWALESFLRDPENIKKIVGILKTKLIAKFGTAENHKIYEVILFTNSNQNICDQSEQFAFGCEGKMWNLEASTIEGEFLSLLKKEMVDQELKTPIKTGFPRMLIANTSYRDFYCQHTAGATLYKDAKTWIDGASDERYEGLSIDSKKLAGKVILSSTEMAIDRVDRKSQSMKKAYSDPEVVPFYSGFTSSTGQPDLLGDKRSGKIQPPKSFDDADVVHVRPSKSPHVLRGFSKMQLDDSGQEK